LVTSGRVARTNIINTTDPSTNKVLNSQTNDTTVVFSSIASLSLKGGTTQNVFNVQSNGAGTPVTITTGASGNAVVVNDVLGTLRSINTLTVNGGTGATLTLDDHLNAGIDAAHAMQFNEFATTTNPVFEVTDSGVVRTDTVVATDPFTGVSFGTPYLTTI